MIQAVKIIPLKGHKKISPYSKFFITVNDSLYLGGIECILKPGDDIFTKDDELTITIDKNAFYLRKEQAFLYAGQVFPRFKFMRKSFFELSKKTVSKKWHIDAGIRAKIEITALIASIFGKESSINEYLHYKFLRYGL